MKAKITLATSMVMLALALTGCGNQAKTKQDSSSSQVSTSQTTEAKKNKQAIATSSSSQENKSASATSSRQNQAPASKQVNPVASDSQRLQQFNQEMRVQLGKTALLPTTPGLANTNGHLNVRYTGDHNNYTVNYSVGYQAKSINDASLNQQIPYLTLTKKTYANHQAATEAIPNHSTDGNGLPKVDLGHNLTGYIEAGAGQRYLMWQEGRWSLTVHATAVNGEDPVPTAKQVVELLEQHYLPSPKNVGDGTFEVSVGDGQQPQTLMWVDGDVVYQLKAHSIDTLIKMAASMK